MELKFRWFNPIDQVFVFSHDYDCLFDFFGDLEYFADNYNQRPEIEQWTGLVDKSKKDIYHKDLIKSWSGNTSIVEWEAPWFCPEKEFPEVFAGSASEWEIVGNIHQPGVEVRKNG